MELSRGRISLKAEPPPDSDVDSALAGQELSSSTLPPASSPFTVTRSMKILSGMTRDERDTVAAACRRLWLADGEVLCHEGEVTTDLYLVASGKLAASKELTPDVMTTVGLVGTDTVLGELAWLDAGPRSATLTAVEDTLVLTYPRHALEYRFRMNDPAAFKLLDLTLVQCSLRLRHVDKQLQEMETAAAANG